MIIIDELNIKKILKDSDLEELFQVSLKKQEWIWVNRDIFLDIIYNALEYDFIDEEDLNDKINNVSEEEFIQILNDKFKEIGWITVDQRLFEKLVDDFVVTEDIETYIYVDRKVYAK